MKKKLFKLLLVFTIMMTCFPASIKAKANEDEIIYADLTEELIETLDEFYFQNKSIYFYDQNGILINDYILQLKKEMVML